jgi:hypothetical protein
MTLYGQYGLNGMHGLQGSFGSLRGLAPKKKDKGPPVAGYYAWYQALNRADLITDGTNVIGWRGHGPGAERLMSPTPSTQHATYTDPGLTFPNATSKLVGGEFGDTRTAFAVFGGNSLPQYAGVLTSTPDTSSNYLFIKTTIAEIAVGFDFNGSGRLNGEASASTLPLVQDGTMNVASAVRTAAGSMVGPIQVGNDRSNSGRNWAGRIGEILLYERVLNEAERSAVERWLAARWGILGKF